MKERTKLNIVTTVLAILFALLLGQAKIYVVSPMFWILLAVFLLYGFFKHLLGFHSK